MLLKSQGAQTVVIPGVGTPTKYVVVKSDGTPVAGASAINSPGNGTFSVAPVAGELDTLGPVSIILQDVISNFALPAVPLNVE